MLTLFLNERIGDQSGFSMMYISGCTLYEGTKV